MTGYLRSNRTKDKLHPELEPLEIQGSHLNPNLFHTNTLIPLQGTPLFVPGETSSPGEIDSAREEWKGTAKGREPKGRDPSLPLSSHPFAYPTASETEVRSWKAYAPSPSLEGESLSDSGSGPCHGNSSQSCSVRANRATRDAYGGPAAGRAEPPGTCPAGPP